MTDSSLSDPITLRVPADVLRDIEEVARSTERSRSWVMVRAMKMYLATEGRDILAVEDGRREIRADLGLGIESVLAEPRKNSAST